MTKDQIEARRAAAIARIEAIESGAPVTGNWTSPQHCINMNRSMVKDCDRRLAELG